jgi:hypothetical protein
MTRVISIFSSPHNSMFLLTTSPLMPSWIFEQLQNLLSFYPVPAYRAYLRDGTGYITSHENVRSRTNYRRTSKSARIGLPTSMIPISWTAYRSSSSIINITVKIFVIKHSHGWLPVGVQEQR